MCTPVQSVYKVFIIAVHERVTEYTDQQQAHCCQIAETGSKQIPGRRKLVAELPPNLLKRG